MRTRFLVLALMGLGLARLGLGGPAAAQDDSKDEPVLAASQPSLRRSTGLEARVDKLNLAQPLADVLDALAKESNIAIQADWPTLAESGVDRTRKLSGQVLGLSVQGCLDIVCRLAGPVVWTQEKNTIVISSRKELGTRVVTQEHLGGGLKAADAVKLLGTLLDLSEDTGVRIADKGEHLAITAPVLYQPQIDRLLTLVRRGMTADEWSQVLGSGRLHSAREAEFNWDAADIRKCLADIAAHSGTTILLDESALLAAGAKPIKVTRKQKALPEKALTQLVEQGGGGLAMEILGRGDIYLVTTREQARPPLASFLVTRSAMVKARVDRAELLLDAITRTVDQGSWAPAGGSPPAPATAAPASGSAGPPKNGRLMIVGNKLLCRQTVKNLGAVGEMLDDPMYKAAARRLATMAAMAAKASTRAGKTTPSGTGKTTPSGTAKTPPSGTAGKTDTPSSGVIRLTPAGGSGGDSPQARQLKLAEVYIKMKRTDMAIEMLQKIVAQYPNTDEAAQARKKLAELKEP